MLSLFVIGAYTNYSELGELVISGPSALLYRARAAHRNEVAAEGFEQIEIEFDPAWLGCGGRQIDPPVRRWIGGRVGAQARALVQRLGRDLAEERLRAELRRFMQQAAVGESDRMVPRWGSFVERRLRQDAGARVADLARELGRHPSWLGTAYRLMSGEGILDTAARLKVERAARLLRETELSLAAVASEAGFCDQSHMNRTLRRVLARTPAAVRRDRNDLRQPFPPPPVASRSPI
ncbi:MAG TPA: AraC family transcriptional regulator [Steroidobacteraceae bacterium]|nr:AraC family transcriptional regulator [Steroidobacteraceae bacterium]